ncbi:Helicase C-terminal [Penicillium samsonianum]|uniref:Helicase C-terminal n=1 Tax=Penicillium samsonianum TaxID=1882272 RepID=UPI0025493B17|nr:Helicase C-terminal [Penicillium samsonianum]KAJ6118683.1 Helicase C-terminal [Penicillium samsonianum]
MTHHATRQFYTHRNDKHYPMELLLESSSLDVSQASGSPAQTDQAASMNWAIYRQLAHVAVHPGLAHFLQRSANNVLSADIDAFNQVGNDREFGLFFHRTIQDRATAIPTNRMAVARYLAYGFLLHLLFTEGSLDDSGPRPRFLVYCNWSFTRWLVEMFLSAIGVDFTVIRASMSVESRSAAIQQFTNPESTTTVLLTTFNWGSLGLNMHGCCSRIILLEGSQNYNGVFQTVGRTHRLGQAHPQKAWVSEGMGLLPGPYDSAADGIQLHP